MKFVNYEPRNYIILSSALFHDLSWVQTPSSAHHQTPLPLMFHQVRKTVHYILWAYFYRHVGIFLFFVFVEYDLSEK
jgi:hypothetical protein